MSYEEKGVWSFLAIAVIGYGVYLWLVLPQLGSTPVADVDYVGPMLWTIGGAIVAGILARIAVEIVVPSEQRTADQRDRVFDRTGERVGNSFVVIGAIQNQSTSNQASTIAPIAPITTKELPTRSPVRSISRSRWSAVRCSLGTTISMAMRARMPATMAPPMVQSIGPT